MIILKSKKKKNIAEIFKSKGELYFRKVESQYLSEVLNSQDAVVSLGGGTPCYGHNINLIKNSKNASSIYLKASIPNLTERLFLEKDNRPMISHIVQKEQLNEFIGKHIFERRQFYSQSNITIETDDKTVDEVIEAIVLKLF